MAKKVIFTMLEPMFRTRGAFLNLSRYTITPGVPLKRFAHLFGRRSIGPVLRQTSQKAFIDQETAALNMERWDMLEGPKRTIQKIMDRFGSETTEVWISSDHRVGFRVAGYEIGKSSAMRKLWVLVRFAEVPASLEREEMIVAAFDKAISKEIAGLRLGKFTLFHRHVRSGGHIYQVEFHVTPF